MMRRAIAAVLCVGLLVGMALGAGLEETVLAPSVTIKAGFAQGSGVIFTRDERCFVLTAGHVVKGLRTVKTRLKDGKDEKYVHFKDASIFVVQYQDNRKVGSSTIDCQVLAYSDADDGEDLAMLEVRKRSFMTATARFADAGYVAPIGTRVYHCGSLHGELGSSSLTDGIVSRLGRVHEGKVYDQTSVSAVPGSSGGGVFAEDGTYVGMITRGAGETFNLMVPARRIREWLEAEELLWVVDPERQEPSPKKDE